MREAWGFKVDATNQRNAGRAARAQGRNAAIGTLLTTGASMAGMDCQGGMFGSGGPGSRINIPVQRIQRTTMPRVI